MTRFWKVQSAGNDFVLVLDSDIPFLLNRCELATRLCDRRLSIGGDGLLILKLDDEPALEMYNPDGSPDFCGNGLMSAAKFAQAVCGHELTQVWHGGRRLKVRSESDGRIEVEIMAATFDPASIPMVDGSSEIFESVLPGVEGLRPISVVQTGSAHAVVLVDALPSDEEFFRISPLVENHSWFPERVSLMWVQPISNDRVKMRIWERGAGETLGCGTGSAAAAVIWMRKTNQGGLIKIENPGGLITCAATDWTSNLRLGSIPTLVYSGMVTLSRTGN